MTRLLLLIPLCGAIVAAATLGVPWWGAFPAGALGAALILHGSVRVYRGSSEPCHRCGGGGDEPRKDLE